ncbi:hypothetical protein BB558_007155 [Smittium angustum]|uniref:AAA+ ATPase domain-containing protein n=1 Tax=Smittium angustum TaxID=133377 RepID=A0A2U1IVU9_SMIAN|nr:hypothetical protein BB558_007155 [Smittium angustum]
MSTGSDEINHVLSLLQEKRKDFQNPEILNNFYSSAFEFLLKKCPECWWCSVETSNIVFEMLDIFSMEDTEHTLEFKNRLSKQLSKCTSCVIAYQDSKKILRKRYIKLYEESSVDEFFNRLEEWDTQRLKLVFDSMPVNMDETALTTIYETLRAPGLITRNPLLYDSLVKALENSIKNNSYPKMKSRILFGMIPLALSSNVNVKKWAKKMLKNSEGKLGLEDYNSGIKNILNLITETIIQKKNLNISNDDQNQQPNSISGFNLEKTTIWQGLFLILGKIDGPVTQKVLMDFTDLCESIVMGILYETKDIGYVLLIFGWALSNFAATLFWDGVGEKLKVVPTDIIQIVTGSDYSKILLQNHNLQQTQDSTGKNTASQAANYSEITLDDINKEKKRLKGLIEWINPFIQSVWIYGNEKKLNFQNIFSSITQILGFLLNEWSVEPETPTITKSAIFSTFTEALTTIYNLGYNEKNNYSIKKLEPLVLSITEVALGDSHISDCEYLLSGSETLINTILLSDLDYIFKFCTGTELKPKDVFNKDMVSESLWLKLCHRPINVELVKITLFCVSNLFLIDRNSISQSFYINTDNFKWFTQFREQLAESIEGCMYNIKDSILNNPQEDSIPFEESILQPNLRFLVGDEDKLCISSSAILTQNRAIENTHNNDSSSIYGPTGVINLSGASVATKHPHLGTVEIIKLISDWENILGNQTFSPASVEKISWLINGFILHLPEYENFSSEFEFFLHQKRTNLANSNQLSNQNENSKKFGYNLEQAIEFLYSWINKTINSTLSGTFDMNKDISKSSKENTKSQNHPAEAIFCALGAFVAYRKPKKQIALEILETLLLCSTNWPNDPSVKNSEKKLADLILLFCQIVKDLDCQKLKYNTVEKLKNSLSTKSNNFKELFKPVIVSCESVCIKKDIKTEKETSSSEKYTMVLSSEPNQEPVSVGDDEYDVFDDLDDYELESILNSLEKTIPGISGKDYTQEAKDIDLDSSRYIQDDGQDFYKENKSIELGKEYQDVYDADEKTEKIDIHLLPHVTVKKKKFLISDWFSKETDSSKIYEPKSYKNIPRTSRTPKITSIYDKSQNTSSSDSNSNVKSSFYDKPKAYKNKNEFASEGGSSLIKQLRREHISNSSVEKGQSFRNTYTNIPVIQNKNLRPIAEAPRSLSLHSKSTTGFKKATTDPLFGDMENVTTFSRDAFTVNNASAGVVYSSSSSSDIDSSDDENRKKGLNALLDSGKPSKHSSNVVQNKESNKRSISFMKQGGGTRNASFGLIRPSSRLTDAQIKAREEELASKRLAPSLNKLHQTILAWRFEDTSKQFPPLSKKLVKVPNTFNSVDEYIECFEPLLFSECWAQLQRSIEETSDIPTVPAIVQSRVSVDKFGDITLQLDASDANQWAEHDLILFATEKKTRPNTNNANANNKSGNDREKMKSGNVNRERFKDSETFIAKIQSNLIRKNSATVTVRTIFDRGGNSSISFINSIFVNSRWDALRLTSLVPVHREYAALQSLKYLPPHLMECILRPKIKNSGNVLESDIDEIVDIYKVNRPQAEAILTSLNKEGFSLIQGPPGTGKTKTILAMVSMLLSSIKTQGVLDPQVLSKNEVLANKSPYGLFGNQNNTTGKLLVCAPSNAAVDEIVQRLKEGIYDKSGSLYIPTIVRVGQSDSISQSVRDITLDQLVEDELERASKIFEAGNSKVSGAGDPAMAAITAQKMFKESIENQKLIRDRINAVIEERQKMRALELTVSKSGDIQEMNNLQKKITLLTRAKNTLSKQLGENQNQTSINSRSLDIVRRSLRNQVLLRAQIICCTLSGSGHEIFTGIAKHFETIIIDEAAQSIELSSVIPLKYAPKRCILVGDPNQLPPTVLSLQASNYGYDRSLFVRMQENCPESVNLLSIQYRMHPDISLFPSQLFYKNLLKDGEGMGEKKAAVWHKSKMFTPFHVFGVSGKESIGKGNSLYNAEEARVVCGMVYKLIKEFPKEPFYHRIGVITPYKQQLRELKRVFIMKFGRQILNAIDFNTVDGFQGQEKDIIIFSCVRSNENTIGFLNDVRRMNVALTRARQSMFVVADVKSIGTHPKWNMLIESAKERNFYSDNISYVADEISYRGFDASKKSDNLLSEEFELSVEYRSPTAISNKKNDPTKELYSSDNMSISDDELLVLGNIKNNIMELKKPDQNNINIPPKNPGISYNNNKSTLGIKPQEKRAELQDTNNTSSSKNNVKINVDLTYLLRKVRGDGSLDDVKQNVGKVNAATSGEHKDENNKPNKKPKEKRELEPGEIFSTDDISSDNRNESDRRSRSRLYSERYSENSREMYRDGGGWGRSDGFNRGSGNSGDYQRYTSRNYESRSDKSNYRENSDDRNYWRDSRSGDGLDRYGPKSRSVSVRNERDGLYERYDETRGGSLGDERDARRGGSVEKRERSEKRDSGIEESNRWNTGGYSSKEHQTKRRKEAGSSETINRSTDRRSAGENPTDPTYPSRISGVEKTESSLKNKVKKIEDSTKNQPTSNLGAKRSAKTIGVSKSKISEKAPGQINPGITRQPETLPKVNKNHIIFN